MQSFGLNVLRAESSHLGSRATEGTGPQHQQQFATEQSTREGETEGHASSRKRERDQSRRFLLLLVRLVLVLLLLLLLPSSLLLDPMLIIVALVLILNRLCSKPTCSKCASDCLYRRTPPRLAVLI